MPPQIIAHLKQLTKKYLPCSIIQGITVSVNPIRRRMTENHWRELAKVHLESGLRGKKVVLGKDCFKQFMEIGLIADKQLIDDLKDCGIIVQMIHI